MRKIQFVLSGKICGEWDRVDQLRALAEKMRENDKQDGSKGPRSIGDDAKSR